MRLKLPMEPKPISTWGVTLANRMPRQEWDDLRSKVYRSANYQCEVCGENNSTLHCHEVWDFDDRKSIQRLAGLQCLCQTCHDVKHFGRSQEVYKGPYIAELIRHWCRVNDKTRADFNLHQQQVFTLNKKRADKFYVVKVKGRILT